MLLTTGCAGDDGGRGSGADARTDGAAGVETSAARADVPCAEGDVGLGRTLPASSAEGAPSTEWTLCFHLDPQRGMVLRDVRLGTADSAVLVAHEIGIAQLEVPYDTGARLTSDITSAGFGGTKMQTLSGTECPGERLTLAVPDIGDGTKFGDVHERDVLCSEVADAGLAYRSEENGTLEAARHTAWSLSTISKVGWYEYVTRYTLSSDGSIGVALGATGDLSPVDFTDDPHHGHDVAPSEGERPPYAASHSHNAVWRVHWALRTGDGDAAAADEGLAVEQYDARDTGRRGDQSSVLDGGLTRLEHPTLARRTDRRWWRVLAPGVLNADGHPISYEIELGRTDSFTLSHDETPTGKGKETDPTYDVAFTNADDCQVFATANRGACGAGVPDYVDLGRTRPLSDVVSWVAVGFHHVPRDEDQSPMQLHWQGFTLLPRDLTAQRLDVPPDRADLNGQPDDWNGEPLDELSDGGAGLGQ
ncbi:copper amine oxidase [Nocardioides albidus]|uniref:Amine oxidase n=2 Tax=Nocardioides albidus TaxID=1517589 RepID=A0A5C4VPQ5_9ACTN|nr:copper amine oxidase [Nocardioides albidus]